MKIHYDIFPGTKIPRKQFAQKFIDDVFSQVSEWDDYTFRVGKYGLQPFSKILIGSSSNFEGELIKDITFLCKNLGPKVGTVLLDLI